MYISTCIFPVECVITTNLAVHIKEVGSVVTCIIPQCKSLIFYCNPSGKEVEWVNPNNEPINSTDTDRIHSKKQFI